MSDAQREEKAVGSRALTLDEFGGIAIAINQVEYSSTPDGPLIHIFGRDRARNAVHIEVTGFRPYFYAPAEKVDASQTPDMLDVDTERRYTSIGGIPLRRIYTRRPADVREFRDTYHSHFEADIPFATRFMIDRGLTGGVAAPSTHADYHDLSPAEVQAPARVCMLDIECEDERGFPDPTRDAVICVTCWDSFDEIYTTFLWLPESPPSGWDDRTDGTPEGCFLEKFHKVRLFHDEGSMLDALASHLTDTDPDIVSGWNLLEFDIPYLSQRMEQIGIDPTRLARLPGRTERTPMRGRAPFDLLMGYKKMQPSQKDSYRLDAIGEEELGRGKVRYTGTVSDLWRTSPTQLVEYNFRDVELCVAIDRKNRIIEFYREIARYVGCPLDRTLNSSQVIDIFILRKSYGRFVLPSKGFAAADEFEGAIVFEPSKGVRDNVVVLDLKSLYPMAMMTINASPETKDRDGELTAPNGVKFKTEPDGLTRSIISELLSEREQKKSLRDKYPFGSPEYVLYDLQQNVMKVIMNTYYGVSGYARFRLYDREIGSAVTSVGRAIILHTRDVIAGLGYAVIYGDTDSCMVQVRRGSLEETILLARGIEEGVNASYAEFAKSVLNADTHYFSIKFEKVYRRFFQAGKKKRYAGHLVWKEGKTVDEIDVTGFELRRSDSPQITKQVQREVIEKILKGEEFDEVRDYLADVIRRYRRGEFSLDDTGIPGGIGKELESYATKDAHIRGAIYSNKYLGTDFKRGSKPKRIYIKTVTRKYPKTDVVSFEYGDQVPPEFVVDWELMLEKTLKQPISRITEALGWNWQDLDPSRTTLFDFGASH